MSDESDDLMGKFKEEIRKRLDEHRPPRSDAGDKDWREPVYGWARNHLPDERNAVRNLAMRLVNNEETQATKRGNKYLRQWAKGQRPLIWSDLGPLPCIVGGVRVRLNAVTPDDMEDFAIETHASGKEVYDEIVILANAALELARNARRLGCELVAEIGDQPIRELGDDSETPDLDA